MEVDLADPAQAVVDLLLEAALTKSRVTAAIRVPSYQADLIAGRLVSLCESYVEEVGHLDGARFRVLVWPRGKGWTDIGLAYDEAEERRAQSPAGDGRWAP